MWYMLDHCVNKVEQNGKWGLADGDGNVISPCVWEEMCDFSCQRAAVKRDGKWGFIDPSGELVIPCVWDAVGRFEDYFDKDCAGVKMDGKWGLIDDEGKLLIPCQWYGIGHHFDDFCLVVYTDKWDCYEYDIETQQVVGEADDSRDAYDRPVVRDYCWG